MYLADYLLALEHEVDRANHFKAAALANLAEQQINATARHYYLTVAHELRGEVD